MLHRLWHGPPAAVGKEKVSPPVIGDAGLFFSKPKRKTRTHFRSSSLATTSSIKLSIYTTFYGSKKSDDKKSETALDSFRWRERMALAWQRTLPAFLSNGMSNSSVDQPEAKAWPHASPNAVKAPFGVRKGAPNISFKT